MSDQAIYTGDLLIAQLDDSGELDIEFVNGQPKMTNFLETTSILYVLGETWWGNYIVDTEAEKMQSEFPEIIKRGFVSDDTLKNGREAIIKSLQPMLTENIASEIDVTGEIFSVSAMGWFIEIYGDLGNVKYLLNWENAQLTLKTEDVAA